MRNETATWLRYAEENLASSYLLLQGSLYNTCLQNVQQAVEKALKAILVEKAIRLKKTHDILAIKNLLHENSIVVDLSDDECDFLNSIYLPSKYPFGGILPDYEPDESVCRDAIEIAEKGILVKFYGSHAPAWECNLDAPASYDSRWSGNSGSHRRSLAGSLTWSVGTSGSTGCSHKL